MLLVNRPLDKVSIFPLVARDRWSGFYRTEVIENYKQFLLAAVANCQTLELVSSVSSWDDCSSLLMLIPWLLNSYPVGLFSYIWWAIFFFLIFTCYGFLFFLPIWYYTRVGALDHIIFSSWCRWYCLYMEEFWIEQVLGFFYGFFYGWNTPCLGLFCVHILP